MASLQGQTIAVAEGRQLEELVQMLEQEGATIVRCPMVSILDPSDISPVVGWLNVLVEKGYDYVVLFTGEGVRRLLAIADQATIQAEVISALGKTCLITRGPKPVKALKEINLKPTKVAETPTTDGVIATLKKEFLEGKSVGVQLYAPTNPALETFLEESGAKMVATLPYVYASASDAGKVSDLIGQMSSGAINYLALTSSPQVDRLFQVSEERNLGEELRSGLVNTRTAAVGPVVAETLRRYNAPVHVCPEQGFVMKNLVKHIKADVEQQRTQGE